MPALRASTLGTRKQELRLRPPVRKSLLVLHAVSGIGWMGVDVALFLLLLDARTTTSAIQAISDYTAVALIVPTAVPLLCAAMLVTGLLLGWGTPWGLTRHWWVFMKLVLSVAMMVLVFFALLPTIRSMPSVSAAGTADEVRARMGSLSTQLMFPPAVSFALLGVATVLSIFKPKGLTPWSEP